MRHIESKCPKCKRKLTAASALDGSNVPISPGDYTICMYCTAFLEFTKKGYKYLKYYDVPVEQREELEKFKQHILNFKAYQATLN